MGLPTGQPLTERNTTHTRQTKKHHVGERLASRHRCVADVFVGTPNDSIDPDITQDLSHRPEAPRSAAHVPSDLPTDHRRSHTCHNSIGNHIFDGPANKLK